MYLVVLTLQGGLGYFLIKFEAKIGTHYEDNLKHIFMQSLCRQKHSSTKTLAM